MVFVLAGACFLAPFLVAGFIPADQYTAAQQQSVSIVQQVAGSLLLTCFAAVLLWIGFGPGKRMFSSAIGFSGFASRGAGDETTGRVIFGGAGILIAMWAVIAWLALVRSLTKLLTRSNEESAQ